MAEEGNLLEVKNLSVDFRSRGGVVHAVKNIDMKIPLVVRLSGTNVEEGRRIIADSGLPIITADTLADAAEKVVRARNEVVAKKA